jgi:uncharacterized repeat protein (TIGR01451 family)
VVRLLSCFFPHSFFPSQETAPMRRRSLRRNRPSRLAVQQLEPRLALAVTPSLVTDINVTPRGSFPFTPTVVGDVAYFSASDAEHGEELWKTDGTLAGTTLVKDISVGPLGSSEPYAFTAVGEKVFFSAHDGVHGRELWVTDGTEGGTQLVADLATGSVETWSPTAGATVLGPAQSWPKNLTAFGGELYFVADAGDANGEAGLVAQLWKTDGTAEGTVQVATEGGAVTAAFVLGDSLFYMAFDSETQGFTLFTVGVSGPVASIPGAYTPSLTVIGSRAYFANYTNAAGQEPWVTDGTAEGTFMLLDAAPGDDGDPSFPTPKDSNPTAFIAFGEAVYFTTNAYDFASGYDSKLWKTTGSADGTTLVKGGFRSFIEDLAVVGGRIVFAADDGENGVELWQSDGTAEGTSLLEDLAPGEATPSGGAPEDLPVPFSSRPFGFTNLGDDLYFFANNGELWKTDGTAEGTELVSAIGDDDGSGSFGMMAVLGDELLFRADGGETGVELWKSDGTDAGTKLLRDIAVGTNDAFDPFGAPPTAAVLGGFAYFAADDGINGTELWKSDGTAGGTSRVRDILGGQGSSDPAGIFTFKNEVYFAARDGFNPGDTGRELWKTDGTAEGTVLVLDIAQRDDGAPSYFIDSNPRGFTAVGDFLYFIAEDGEGTTGIWKTDGTGDGTEFVAAFDGTFSENRLVAIGEDIYFVGNSPFPEIGTELWYLDTTTGGFAAIDLVAGSASSSPTGLVAHDGLLYFVADLDGTAGLWVIPGETSEEYDLPNLFEGQVGTIAIVNDTVYFSGLSVDAEGEATDVLYTTDGTPDGTGLANVPGLEILPDVAPLAAIGSLLLFVDQDADHGRELWSLLLNDDTPPTVAITDDVPGTATGPVTFTFTFSEPVTGFTADDVVVANGTKGAFTAVNSSVYTLVIAPSVDTVGTLTVSLNPGAGIDAAGNESLGTSVTQPFDTTPDAIPPTVLITDNVPGTATGPVTFTFTFSESATGFTADDIAVTGGTKGSFTTVDQQVYRLVVAPLAGSVGVVMVSLAAGAATDLAGNASLAATASQAYNLNTAPAIVSPAAVSIVEGLPLVLSVVAEDPNGGQTLAYSVTGGPDAALFTFVGSGLVLQPFRGPSFASPADVGADNVYEVTIAVTDGFATVTQDVRVTILAPTGNLAVSEIGDTTPGIALAQALVGDGITISNVQFTGTGRSAGFFSGGLAAGLGMRQGIVLSSGLVTNAIGPNTADGTGFSLGTSGSTDLNALIPGFTTFDATVLEFDFVVAESALSFQYVFASEEYNEFVNSSFNDVFGFFVDGVNIARLPGTTTPVAINNVNAELNAGFYRNNDPGDLGQPTPFATAADGFTSVLQASVTLLPGTHRIKLAIADAGDSILDSWVFLSTQSFVSGSGDLRITAGSVPAVVAPGAEFTLNYTVTNAGSEAVSGALFQAALPAGLEFVAATMSQGLLAHAGGFMTGTIGDLAGGASASIGVTVRVVGAGELFTNAFVQADQIDPVTSNNSAGVSTSVNVPPTITSSATVTVVEGRAEVLTVTATDPNPGTTFVFSIAGGADAALFSFDGATLRLLAPAGAVAASPADADGNGIYEVRIRVGDGLATTEQNVVVTIIADAVPPTVAITDDVPGTATGPVTFTFTFSEPVTGFTADDVVVANGTKGAFTAVTAAIYSLVVTPAAGSTAPITVALAAGAAQDLAGNPSVTAAASQPVDTAPPTVAITDDAPGIATGPVTFTFTFSEPVTGFTADDAVVANGTKGAFAAVSATEYTLVVTPSAAAAGPLTVSLAAGAATDAVGNPSGAASTTQDIPVRSVIGAAAPAGVVREDTGVDATGGLVATGSFTIVDPNPGEAAFKTVVAVPAGVTNLGTLAITSDGTFTYRVLNSLDAVQALRAGETRTDVFTIESLDGTRLDVTFSIAGVADVLAGVVADGYLAGATVFADANGNRVLDAGELFTTTDSAGNFSFDFGSLTATLVTIGGTDISTGLPFAGSLLAPAGSAVINPLTTIVAAVVAAGAPPADSTALAAAVAAASSQVVAGLGLPAVSLTTFDPLSAGADAQTALAVQKAAASVANVIVVAGTVGASPATVVANLAAAVTTVAPGQTVNLGDATVLTSVLTTGATPPPAAAVTSVAQANAQIATAATINAVAQLQTVVQSASAFVEENAATDTVVFQAATPAGMTAPAFSLKDVAGDDKSFVSVNSATGAVRLLAPANFEAKASYRFTVVASQEGQATVETAITVAVTDVNEAPTNIGLSASTITENSAVGAAIGTLSTSDVDAGDTFTYALVAGEGSADNSSFTIDGNTLKTAASFNFEAKSSYTIRVKSTDAGGLATEKQFTITVTDVVEPLAIDRVLPPASRTYRAGEVLQFTVVLTRSVTVIGKPEIDLTVGRTRTKAVYQSGSGTNQLVFAYTVKSRDTDTDGVALGSVIKLPRGSSIRLDSTNLPLALAAVNTSGVLVDTTPPKVNAVSGPANGSYKAGQVLRFTATLSEPVTVTGVPTLPLTIGTTARQAAYVAGASTPTSLVFEYTVQAGETDANGIAAGRAIVLPSGASIVDVAGNAALLAIRAPNLARVLVDSAGPVATSIKAPAAKTYGANAPIDFVVNFNEPVVVTGSPTLPVQIGSAARSAAFAGYAGRSGNKSLVFRISTQAGDADTDGVSITGPLGLAGAVIADAAGNAAAGTLPGVNLSRVLVDGVGPTIVSVDDPEPDARGRALLVRINFNEPVLVRGTPAIPFQIGSSPRQLTYVSGSRTRVLTFRYVIQTIDNIENSAVTPGTTLVLGSGAITDTLGNAIAALTLPG